MRVFELKHRLNALRDASNELIQSIEPNQIICASDVGDFLTGEQAHALLTDRVCGIWYSDDQTDARQTPVAIGAAGISPESMAIAFKVNTLKQELKSQLMELREWAGQNVGSRAGKDKSFRRYLNDIGFGRLSLRQLYRQLPVLPQMPKKLTFSYSTKGRSIVRITVEQAIHLLDHSGFQGPHIEVQRDTLRRMPSDTPLARVQDLSSYWKANVTYDTGHRSTLPVWLPILFEGDLSSVSLPFGLKGRQRDAAARADREVSTIALIPSLRLYPYLASGIDQGLR